MNLSNQKSGFLFGTRLTLVAAFAITFFGLIITPANAATDGWHIKDDATGGECSTIGNWDAGSKTCTLSQDLNQGIIIDSNNIVLDGNERTITGSNAGSGVYLSSRTGVTIKNLNIDKFNYGILLWWSSNNTLTGNTASNNNSSGIFLHSSSNNTLTGNTASNNRYGISLYGSSNNNNTLIGNTASNNSMYGISIEAPSNTMTDNTASNNTIGIDLSYYSRNNTLTDNIAQENSYYDLRVRGDTTIDCSNTITNTTGSGGRPIKYFNNAVNLSNETLSGLILCNADGSNIHDITIDGSATKQNNGLVLIRTDSSTIANVNSSNNYTGIQLHSSTGNTLTGNTASSNSNTGIDLVYSSNNTLTGNTASNNGSTGIYLQYSNYNTLTSNTASNNSTGIWIYYSNYNTITDNTANSNDGYYGISISYSSSNNIVTGNTASNNRFGIAIYGSSSIYGSQPLNNQTYKNNFIGNTTQVFAISGSGVFNLASPIGGNYWSNFDEPSEGCNNLNNDGFCDSPYVFSGGQDNLPWTKKDGWLAPLNNPPTLSYSQKQGFESDADSPGVEPNEGTAEQTSFVFRIIYTDVDNDPPVEVSLLLQKLVDYPDFLIDYGEYALLEEDPQDTDYTDGKEYFISIPLPEGKFRYYFRAVQMGGPVVVTAPFPSLTPGEEAKWLEVGTNKIPIPDEVLSAEDIYYNTLKNDLRESTFIYSEMVTKKTIETTFSLIAKGLTQSWGEIAKLDNAAQLRETTKKVAMDTFGSELVKELQKRISYPTDVTTNIVTDVLEKGFLLENYSGEPFQEVVDNIHNGFVATTLNISPDNEVINKSVERLGHLNNLAETTSYEAETMKRKFNQLEDIKDKFGAYSLFIRLGGNFAEIRSEKEKNVAAGVLALATSQVFSTIKSFISFDQWLALMDWYGELWLVENRATRLFRKGIEGTVHVLNTGEFPSVAVNMVREIVPETVELGSIGTFGGVLKNTGGETTEARLTVTITEPSLFFEGWPRIFTTETILLPPNSEETSFTINVPFFGGLPLINTGKAIVQTTVEYGVLGLEYSTENEQKTFEITHNLFPIIKTIRTNLDGSSDETLISIYIANNESETKTFTVIDEIPKSLSTNLSNVIFSTSPDRIVNPDPVVAWDIKLAPGEFVILTYEITSGEIDNIFSFPHAEIVGDNINEQSSLTVISEEDAQSLGSDSLDLLIKAIESASANAFVNKNTKNALIAKINEVVEKTQNQEFSDAVNKLIHDIRPKLDGQELPKDWVIAEDTRLTLLGLVDSAIVFISALPQN